MSRKDIDMHNYDEYNKFADPHMKKYLRRKQSLLNQSNNVQGGVLRDIYQLVDLEPQKYMKRGLSEYELL